MNAILLLLAVASLLPAQERLALPDGAPHPGSDELLAVLAQLAPDSDAVLRRAYDETLAPRVRLQLCDHAERIARAAQDVAAGLRAADARATIFAVTRDAAREACLARFEAESAAPAQALAGARLGEAARLLEGARVGFDAQVRVARRLAAVDQPPGLGAHVEFTAGALETVRAAFERSAAAPGERAQEGRYRALYLGQWEAALGALRTGEDRAARIADSKVRAAAAETVDMERLARSAEEWLSLSQREPDVLAQGHLRRRAMALLLPVARASGWTTTDEVPEWLRGAEGHRVRALLDRATDLAAESQSPASRLRFASPADLDRLCISGGEWRVADGGLIGRSAGAATRATARFAWQRIDCVTIRGGIAARDGLNFRIAIGDFNALFNWEVEDQNHFYFGEHAMIVGPRRLRAGQEHVIRVWQVGELIVVTVDGDPIALGPGTLAGSVSVYPAVGSEIFVRAIDVVGDVDLATVVTGPTGKAR